MLTKLFQAVARADIVPRWAALRRRAIVVRVLSR